MLVPVARRDLVLFDGRAATYPLPMPEPAFDPTAPLAPAPEPWASTTQPSRRDGPPYHMTEMIAAEPHIARRIVERLADPQGAAGRLAGAIGQAASTGAPIVVTGCGTSEHAALATVEILREAIRAAGMPSGAGVGRLGAGLRARPRPAERRARDRRLARGRDRGDEPGARRRVGAPVPGRR